MIPLSDAADVVGQDTLPLELPDYHGRKPVGMRTSLSGAGNRIQREHGIGERGVLVVEYKCSAAGHRDTDDGLLYVESHKVVDMFEVGPKEGARLLAVMRQKARVAGDAGKRTPLEADGVDMGEVGYTDASGVVLTPKELAAIRDDPASAIIGDTSAVVVVYDSGERRIWPDEYDGDTIRPSVGDHLYDPSSTSDVIVTEVLDGVTGEPVDDYDPDFVVDAEILDADEPAAADTPEPFPDGGDDATITHLPNAEDWTFVDRDIAALKDDLEDIIDADHLRRLVTAEQQGRGRALKPRKGALEAIEARLAKVTSGVVMDPSSI